MKRKGIILAGGSGTRLYPTSLVISKQLLPIFNKPMIYYPLSILLLANIKKILLISTPKDIPLFKSLLGDGGNWGIKIEYAIQSSPDGLAQALIIAEDFLKGSPSILILGDNIFYGHNLEVLLTNAGRREEGATLFAYHVHDPERYGVVNFDENNQVLSLEEKPLKPTSNFAVTGLYFYDKNAPKTAKRIKPSERGELEITDLNKAYLGNNQLYVEKLQRGFAWLDTGTYESMLEAHQFVQTIEHRQGQMIACLEEIAFMKGWISESQLIKAAKTMDRTKYGKYLFSLASKKKNDNNTPSYT